MVAIIKTGHSIRRIFNYNENKISAGVATCIGEKNYPMDIDKMSASLKLNLFLKQLELNENVTRNAVHISLNFDPSEKDLTTEKLMQIANIYMDKIGFGNQPYLVYQHHDAGHPHIHIISIKVKRDGKRIDMQNIGRNQSEVARIAIEEQFKLVKASTKSYSQLQGVKPLPIKKLQYGQNESRSAIATILNHVIPNYTYCSIMELNAVLNLFNVKAEMGKEGSRMFLHKGLTYSILNADGKAIGVPIKASDFYNKPTLKFLEERFKANKNKPLRANKRIKNSIDLLFLQHKINLKKLTSELEKQGIVLVLRTNPQGQHYGITYVDHTTKCVFNGSSLGKEYSAKRILERCDPHTTQKGPTMKKYHTNQWNEFDLSSELKQSIDAVIGSLIEPVETSQYLVFPHKGKRKKRKKRGQSNNQ
jgi:hypothetical protein